MFNHTRLWAAAVIIGVIIVGGFVLSIPRAREVADGSPLEATSTPRIMVHDVFKKGIHTISGSVLAPDACATVSVEASLVGEEISLALSVSEDTSICLEVPTSVTFSTSVTAPAGASIRTTLNGVPVVTTDS